MEYMCYNAEIHRRNYGDISQLTNFILYSGATYHTTPEISDFIPGSLLETETYSKVSDGNFVAAKQTGQVQIEMCNNNKKSFISTLYNMLLAPDLCDQLFSIIKLMDSVHN